MMETHKDSRGYLILTKSDRKRQPILEHILVAEKALGKQLPKGAVVHHANEVKTDNTPSNLVICPNSPYHELLHQRLRAWKACGHASWRKCNYCKEYDEPKNLRISPKNGSAHHPSCINSYSRNLYWNRKMG